MPREKPPSGLCLPGPPLYPRVVVLVIVLAFVLVLLYEGYDLASALAAVASTAAIAVMVAQRMTVPSWRPSIEG